MYNKIEHQIIIIIIARKQAVETKKLDQFGSGIS